MLVFLRNYHPQTDAQHYIDIATSVAHGHGFAADYPYGWVHATAFRPPLYPLLLGAAFAVFGVHLAVAQALNVVHRQPGRRPRRACWRRASPGTAPA